MQIHLINLILFSKKHSKLQKVNLRILKEDKHRHNGLVFVLPPFFKEKQGEILPWVKSLTKPEHHYKEKSVK